jgi:cytochrome P450
MFWWIVLAVVVLVVVFVAYPRKRYFPGPKIYGYLGTVAASRHINDRHRYWRSWHEKFRVVQFQRGNTPIFVVFEPEDFRFVFSNKEVFGDRPRAVLSALGRNVLSMEVGTEWAEHRRLLSPLFAEKYMREYVTMMDSKLLSLSGRLRKSAGAPVDALQVMMSAALDVIGVCGFGVDFQCLETADVQTPFMKASNTLLEEGARANLVPVSICSDAVVRR